MTHDDEPKHLHVHDAQRTDCGAEAQAEVLGMPLRWQV